MKYCKYCDSDLPLDRFAKRSLSPDGLGYKCKECSSAYQKKRYLENVAVSDAAKKRASKWVSENKDRRNEISRNWDERNREANRARGLAYAKRVREERPDEMRMKGRIAAQKRRHRMVECRGYIQRGVAERIIKMANGKCVYCGNSVSNLTLDHFHPVSKGGDGAVDNLVPCCGSCNSSKKDKDPCEWVEKMFGIDKLIDVYWTMQSLSAARLP